MSKDTEVKADISERRSTKPPQRKLAGSHYETLSCMAADTTKPLRKLQGGFWVVDPHVDEYEEGQWCSDLNVVSALLKLGLVRRCSKTAVELTPLGIEAVRTGLYTPVR